MTRMFETLAELEHAFQNLCEQLGAMVTANEDFPLLVVDLFSGAGGMSYGFKYWGDRLYKIIGAVDLEVAKPSDSKAKKGGGGTNCNATYEANIGIRPLKADLTELNPREYRENLGLEVGQLGVLISCAPCTGFSQKNFLNHQNDDPRNHLVRRSGVFLEEFLPEFFVMENVPEMMLGKHRHHFEELKEILVGLGYSYTAGVLDFSTLGLPQRRKRAVVMAWREGRRIPALPRFFSSPPTVREAIGHLPPLSAGETHPNDPMHRCPRHTPEVMERIKAVPRDGGSWIDLASRNPELLIPSMKRKLREGKKGSFPDVYGRMSWNSPAPTITRECGHPGNGRYLHPEQDRMLSIREMAILQGFPPNYTFIGNLNQCYNQIGDAVPPLVSRTIAGLFLLLKLGLNWGQVMNRHIHVSNLNWLYFEEHVPRAQVEQDPLLIP